MRPGLGRAAARALGLGLSNGHQVKGEYPPQLLDHLVQQVVQPAASGLNAEDVLAPDVVLDRVAAKAVQQAMRLEPSWLCRWTRPLAHADPCPS